MFGFMNVFRAKPVTPAPKIPSQPAPAPPPGPTS